MQFVKDCSAEELVRYYERMGLAGVIEYWKRKNTITIDGMATGIFDDD